ncbi:DUF982 domain-containing protein [Ensifer sp. NM-2]|jgi:hypothetical protein|uniref:DUF982 domain-containing protein n=1 Tax=unclassified Ensifer TaxID=2633371 RepID=UPI0009E80A6B|nr:MULTISPECIES: DUF982 domain-containing protein [unclassified Ensifer]PSS64462.1 DUF982 domain-containing protein [Ensifer sp. NM-2]
MHIPEMPWSVPLLVRLQNGTSRVFSSVYDALDFLENEWPLRRGQRYERAIRTCRGALNRSAPIAVAREAFIAACLEAGMPATGTFEHLRTSKRNDNSPQRAA